MHVDTKKSAIIDVTEFPIFKGYVVGLAIRYYVFIYIVHVKSAFLNMKYGNIVVSLLAPFLFITLAMELTNMHITESLALAIDMYDFLSTGI